MKKSITFNAAEITEAICLYHEAEITKGLGLDPKVLTLLDVRLDAKLNQFTATVTAQ